MRVCVRVCGGGLLENERGQRVDITALAERYIIFWVLFGTNKLIGVWVTCHISYTDIVLDCQCMWNKQFGCNQNTPNPPPPLNVK